MLETLVLNWENLYKTNWLYVSLQKTLNTVVLKDNDYLDSDYILLQVGLQKRLNGVLLVEDRDYILPCWSIEKIKWCSISKIMTM